MIDCINIVANIEPPYKHNSIKSFEWCGLWFNPVYFRGTKIIKGYDSEFNGLRVFIEYNKIKISNSLHKFYKGNNYSDFSMKEINYAIDKLCNQFDINANEWIIKKLEFGFNITTPKPAIEYLDCIHSFKGVVFDKMKKKGRIYGMIRTLNEYFIKYYDKSLEYKIHERIDTNICLLRVEIGYDIKRKLPEEIRTLADLQIASNIDILYKELTYIVSNVYYRYEIDFTNTTYEERLLLLASEHKDFFVVEKRENKTQLKAIRTNIKQIRTKVTKKDFPKFLINSLKNKYIQLYCS